MATCLNCDAELFDGDGRCGFCGHFVESAPAAEVVVELSGDDFAAFVEAAEPEVSEDAAPATSDVDKVATDEQANSVTDGSASHDHSVTVPAVDPDVAPPATQEVAP